MNEMFTTAAATAEKPLTAAEQLAKWDRFVHRESTRQARRFGLDREDLVQEIRLRVLTSFKTYTPAKGSFGTWLGHVIFTTARVLLSHRNTHTHRKATSLAAVIDDEDATLAEAIADHKAVEPGDEAARRERIASVRTAIESLPDAQREAVKARFWGETIMKNLDAEALAAAIHELAGLVPIDEEGLL